MLLVDCFDGFREPCRGVRRAIGRFGSAIDGLVGAVCHDGLCGEVVEVDAESPSSASVRPPDDSVSSEACSADSRSGVPRRVRPHVA